MITNEFYNNTRALIVGSACVVFSRLTPEELRLFKVYMPEALMLKNESGEQVYSLDYDDEEPGCIMDDHAVYGAPVSSEGKATITVVLEPMKSGQKELVESKLGNALVRLDEMEKRLIEMIPMAEERAKAVQNAIGQM